MSIHFHLLSNFYSLIKYFQTKNISQKRKEILEKICDENGLNKKYCLPREMMSRPLCSNFILSSHNSYLANFQNFDLTDIDVINFLLKIGVRCLEFDVYYRNNELVVGHGTKNIFHKSPMDLDLITTNVIPLKNIFELLREKAFEDNWDIPLFINLELLTRGSESAHIQIANLISNYFGKNLLRGEFFYAAKNIGECRLSHLRHKIIFITGRKLDNLDPLKKYINAFTYKLEEIENHRNIDPKVILNLSSHLLSDEKIHGIIQTHIQNKGLVRVYPQGGIMNNFGWNFDFQKAMELQIQFVSMNIQQMNHGVKEYLEHFKDLPLLAQKNGKINKRKKS